jgi:4-diphosphocytidyl-2-C-methyl-D-erythritol kinase
MVVFPGAKINIGLHVTGKRNDGYHTIESVFYPIPLCDILEIVLAENAPGFELQVSGIDLPGNPADNLCSKAYRLFNERHPLPGAKAALHKIIPAGAGLGGGSSDGSHTLLLLNELSGNPLGTETLLDLASGLGSDCPFFIRNTPAFVTGRGEVLEPISLDLAGFHILLVHPRIHVPTVEAYKLVKPAMPEFSLRDLPRLPVSEWRANVKNDFEEGIFRVHPEIKEIKESLYAMGAVYASMSGSGSSVFGIFSDEPGPPSIFGDYFVWKGRL